MRKNAVKSYYTDETMILLHDAYKEAYDEFKTGKVKHVKISNGNSKMGKIPSVSLLPYTTCPANCKGTCGDKCYAAKLSVLRPSVRKSYARNTVLAIFNPERYWADVEKAIKLSRYFRFHVSGDNLSKPYLYRAIQIAIRNPETHILMFTKRFEWVNEWISNYGELPNNLHILFSGWTNLKPDNPYSLPETMTIERTKGGERMKDFNEREFYESMYAFVKEEGAKAVERSCAYEWGTNECNREIETANEWYNALLNLETIMYRKGFLK